MRKENPMTSITTLLRSVAAAAFAALTLTATASADGGPGLTVGSGCAAQCIKKALVTVTASTAKVELETTVLAHLKVYVTKQSASNGGGLIANQAKVVSISAFSPKRTAFFLNLEPDTDYSIAVHATDLQGRKASQKGSFKTLPIKTTGQGGPGGFDSGLGCAAECIEQALFKQTKPAATIANADLRTSVDALIQIVVSRDKAQSDVVSSQLSPGYVREWKTQIGGLDYGRVYHVVVRAKDLQGRTSIRQGKFKTVSASALVTIHKLKVLNDGDKWGKGELYFSYWGGGKLRGNQGYQKIDSGSVVNAKQNGAGRPGILFRLPANGDAKLRIYVSAQECDAVLMKNCVVEAGGPEAAFDARAGGLFDLSDILAGGALPGWHGTGVQPPAGHDGYFVFETTKNYVKFLVMATVDVDVDWP
jgi:hypothetical protein